MTFQAASAVSTGSLVSKYHGSCPDHTGLVDSEKTTPYRDTRGPALAEAQRLHQAPNCSTLKGKRDFAVLVLFGKHAFRRGELQRCNVGDFPPQEARLFILGKGRDSEREPITLFDAAVNAIRLYLESRGPSSPESAFFMSCARFVEEEQRLTGSGLYHVISEYGNKALGKDSHPHALRHMVLAAYDDNTSERQGHLTRRLSALLHEETK